MAVAYDGISQQTIQGPAILPIAGPYLFAPTNIEAATQLVELCESRPANAIVTQDIDNLLVTYPTNPQA